MIYLIKSIKIKLYVDIPDTVIFTSKDKTNIVAVAMKTKKDIPAAFCFRSKWYCVLFGTEAALIFIGKISHSLSKCCCLACCGFSGAL